jgi:uncharacterized protein (TIGR02444 family)
MDFPDHPFWDFSLQVYSRDGVGTACIHLQEHHGIDVNVMLFCLWLGETGRGVLDAEECAAMTAAVEKWHLDVVKGLRGVRRILKDGFPDVPHALRESLRGEVQAAEIDSEHLQQLLLAASVDRAPAAGALTVEDRAGDATRNFDLYLNTLGVVFEPADSVQFAHILGQAFPGLAPERALDNAEVLM